jgi:hypothetical protein
MNKGVRHDLIWALDLITDGAQRPRRARDDGSRWRHGRQRWLAELGPRACYGSPNPKRFVPTVSQRVSDFVSLTFKRWRAAWRAGGGDFLL